MPERTALAGIEWTAGRATIRKLSVRLGRSPHVLEEIEQADKTGIDCPLGWPTAFVVSWPPTARAMSAFLSTVLARAANSQCAVRTSSSGEQAVLVSLSVSADRIAHVALRCAIFLAKLDAARVTGSRRVQDHHVVDVGRLEGRDVAVDLLPNGMSRATTSPLSEPTPEKIVCVSRAFRSSHPVAASWLLIHTTDNLSCRYLVAFRRGRTASILPWWAARRRRTGPRRDQQKAARARSGRCRRRRRWPTACRPG